MKSGEERGILLQEASRPRDPHTALRDAGAPPSRTLISVQYARAFAASLVVWAHVAGFHLASPLHLAEFGGFGVDLFFVISGYIMWTTTGEQTPATFAVRRVARIVPAYWFYTTVLIALSLILPRLTPNVHVDSWAALRSYLFVPYENEHGDVNPILLQGWTLNFEMFFYAIFGLALFVKQPVARLVLIAFFLIASAAAGAIFDPRSAILQSYTSAILLEFLAGIFVSAVWPTSAIRKNVAIAMVVIAALALIAASQTTWPADWRFATFGVPSAILLKGLIALEGTLRTAPSAFLLTLGDASYSLYLVHPFVLSACAACLKFMVGIALVDARAAAWLFIVVGPLACVVAARISYRLVEKPSGRLILRAYSQRCGPSRAARSKDVSMQVEKAS